MDPDVVVGIHAQAEAERLVETVRSVRGGGGPEVRIVLLPDGPDAGLAAALAAEPELAALPRYGTGEPQGAPACFNRLAAGRDADIVILVESGTVLGPGCLALLVEALACPGRGLAGPSTNRAWNEQGVFPRGRSSDVGRTAALARQRFGAAARSLAPLHSLADFCYAVRREVIETIGLTDERYGLGPCWEMDYNIRAARAGWPGVWVGGAYAYRHQVTERRREAEARLMDHSRHLYQDSFCGLRLSGARDGYREHCRGEACEHFAPVALSASRQGPAAPRLPGAAPRQAPAVLRQGPTVLRQGPAVPRQAAGRTAAAGVRPRGEAVPAVRTGEVPLVSCVMPTFNRRAFVPQAVRYFLRQDYPAKELIVVDDGPEPVGDLLPDDDRVRYHRLAGRSVLGAKRNLGCDLARGSIIVHWDDDDWISPDRVSVQVAALGAGRGDVCGVSRLLFYDPAGPAAWRFSWPGRHRPWAAGTSLCFTKELWTRSPFPEVAIGEDTKFVFSPAVRRISYVDETACIVALIHRGNTAPKAVRGPNWSRAPVREVEDVLGEDLPFYRGLVVAEGSRRG